MEVFFEKSLKEKRDLFVFLMENQSFSLNFDLKEGLDWIEKLIEEKGFKGTEGEFKFGYLPKPFKLNVFFIGLGKKEKLTLENFKNILGNYFSKIPENSLVSFNPYFLRVGEDKSFEVALNLFSNMDYKYDEFLKEKFKEKKVLILKPKNKEDEELSKILKKVKALKEGIFLAKDLSNSPSSSLSSKDFIKIVQKLGEKYKWKVNLYDEKKLKSLKLPGIVSVGKGSQNPPYLIEIKLSEKVEKVLIGKGVLFDSGGLSLKPAEGMENMKFDKSGACSVLGTLLSLSILGKKDGVAAYIPLVENLVSHKSLKPGDILTYPNGKTVEIISTDAEGRLILADALILASQEKPKFIITIATLTGALRYSLGSYAAGLFTKDEKLEKMLLKSASSTGEFLWSFPLWEEYETLIKGDYTDLKNSSGGVAGSISGGLFLTHFTEVPFAHLDIALVAYKTEKKIKGSTGFGVSLLVDFLSNDTY